MKRLISLFLAVIMIFSFAVPVFATSAVEITSEVVEEESEFSAVRVFEIIWGAIKKYFLTFKNIFKNVIAFFDSLFKGDEPEEPTTKEPTTEEPTTEEPTTEERTTEEPTTEEPTTEEPTTKEPTTEEPTTEEPTTEEPTTEEPTTEKPTTDETTVVTAIIVIAILDLDGEVSDTLNATVPAGTELSELYIIDMVESNGYTPMGGVYGTFDLIAEAGQTYNFEVEL